MCVCVHGLKFQEIVLSDSWIEVRTYMHTYMSSILMALTIGYICMGDKNKKLTNFLS